MVNAFESFSIVNFSVYIVGWKGVGWKGVGWVIDESLLVFSLFVNLLGQVVGMESSFISQLPQRNGVNCE